jgi:hypothetical protein
VYVTNLGLCIKVNFISTIFLFTHFRKHFLQPLRDAVKEKKHIIDMEAINAIFSDLEIIHNFNQQLLSELEPIVEKWSALQCLGKIFLKIVTKILNLKF